MVTASLLVIQPDNTDICIVINRHDYILPCNWLHKLATYATMIAHGVISISVHIIGT